jgi:anti-sigma factor RsiW
MRECIEEGILQSYFDGELSSEMMEGVASHLASCLNCARAAREMENENALLAQALEPEFALSVPTERLRHRLDAAIAGIPVVGAKSSATVVSGFSKWIRSFGDLFTLSPQRTFGYVGLAAVILFMGIFGIVQLRRAASVPPPEIAKQPSPVTMPGIAPPEGAVAVNTPSPKDTIVPKQTPAKYSPKRSSRRSLAQNEEAKVKLLPGERSYLKTIAALDSTIKTESDAKPMTPALQAEYERNLAMVDRAIAATRSAAKKNPSDPDAAEFMFAAYQSKVDLLNQVADARLSNRQH